ncbi:DUF4861 family protein [Litorimonas sp. RW-G-Af-16]|uniref:DUF4861 family protein n=1 Tax=Litorimonas sp. RW-G-Af-16 TaxID=3241168 RepID=UPI00390CA45D
MTQFFKPLLPLSAAVILAACSNATSTNDQSSKTDRAGADIGLLQEGGQSVKSFTTPEGFKRGDKLVAYEGPGWESDKVGYRIYLDGRNALDIFGKRTAPIVLSTVGRGDDYHAMADWGMDILKVGNSLGAGGFGVFDNGEVRQIGDAASYQAEILADDMDKAVLRVTHNKSETCGGDVSGTYTINAGERLTHIDISGDCALPYAAGLIIHDGTSSLVSGGSSGWQYKARYGDQSLVPDGLGLALFYRGEDVSAVSADADDDYIVFKTDRSPRYVTGAAWVQEDGGIQSQAEFLTWLQATQAKLNATAK